MVEGQRSKVYWPSEMKGKTSSEKQVSAVGPVATK